MPCRDDYLDPNNEEKDSKKLASVMKILYQASGQKIPEFIRQAAGRERGMFGLEQVVAGAVSGSDGLSLYTKEACRLLNHMGEDKRTQLFVEDEEVREWYQRHGKADVHRSKIETDPAYRQSLLKSALGKISDEERIAIRFYFMEKFDK